MPIPKQTFVINDPGLGVTDPAAVIPLFYGPASGGVANEIKTFSSPTDLVAHHKQGAMPEAAAYVLANSGGPVRTMKSATTVAASNGSVTPSRVSTSTGTITVAGTANDDYEFVGRIKKTGTLGTGVFDYSLDDGYTFSAELTIPSGGTYAITETGLTLTFVPGGGPIFFEAGDKHEFDSVGAMWNASDLAAGVTAILASSVPWRFLVCCGQPASAAAAATLFAALGTHMTSLENVFRYRRAMMDVGKDTTTNVLTSFAAQVSKRILPAYGDMDVASGKPMVGWAVPKRATLQAFARNATGPATQGWGFPSTDLKRVRGGPVPGIVAKADGSAAISHDEYKTEVLDAARISTLRTYPELSGVYVTNGRLKSAAGSDFEYWQHGILMDIACETVYAKQALWIGEGLRTNADGTIDERDAARIEKEVNAALSAVLMTPVNAGGQIGHVSDVRYTVSRTHNLLTTKTLVSEVAIRPLGYVDFITTTLGYQAAVLPAAA
jgi:hypothetical protein